MKKVGLIWYINLFLHQNNSFPDGPILNRDFALEAASFLIIHRPFLERTLGEVVVTTMDW